MGAARGPDRYFTARLGQPVFALRPILLRRSIRAQRTQLPADCRRRQLPLVQATGVELSSVLTIRKLRMDLENKVTGFERPQFGFLFRQVVIQVLSEPSLDLGRAHSLTFAMVGDRVAVDLAETEISRFRVEVKTTPQGRHPIGCNGITTGGLPLHFSSIS
jgi:hypothetical protein